LLTVAGLLDLDRLGQLQQRLDDTPASGRAVYAINGIERNPAPHSVMGLSWVFSAPDPRGQRTNRRAGVCWTRSRRSGAGAHRVHRQGGPYCSPPPPPRRPSRTAADVMTSSPDDSTPGDTAPDVTAPGGVPGPFVPSAKIALPQLSAEFVVRPALRAALDAADRADVGSVCAPAGYGKTLLLADWARTSTGADVAWVGLDRDDNDPKRLWASVIAAVAVCPSVPADSRLHGPWLWRPAAQPGVSRRTRGGVGAAARAG